MMSWDSCRDHCFHHEYTFAYLFSVSLPETSVQPFVVWSILTKPDGMTLCFSPDSGDITQPLQMMYLESGLVTT